MAKYKVVVECTSRSTITYEVEAEEEWQAGERAEAKAEWPLLSEFVTEIDCTTEEFEYEATNVVLVREHMEDTNHEGE